MFAEDAIAFGSKVEMMTSRAALEREQWRAVWPTMEDYRYDLSTLEVAISPDRLMAMGAAIFRSTGLHAGQARRFDRNGRATATLMRDRGRRAVDLHPLPRLAQARHADAVAFQSAGSASDTVRPSEHPVETPGDPRARDVRQDAPSSTCSSRRASRSCSAIRAPPSCR